MQNTERMPTNQYKKNTQPNSEVGYSSQREHPADQQEYRNVPALVIGEIQLSQVRPRYTPPGTAPIRKTEFGSPLGLQWVRRHAPNAGAWIRFLDKELDPLCHS